MIIVTGGTGAMGSVLVRMLAEQKKKVRVVCLPNDPFAARIKNAAFDIRYADISNKVDIRNVCEGVQTVYHLAAIIISKDEKAFTAINVEGTRNIIAEAARSGVKHFIYVSSASVTYPAPTPYSLSKRAAEEIVENVRPRLHDSQADACVRRKRRPGIRHVS